MDRPRPITNAEAAAALDKAAAQVRLNLPKYTKRCQKHSSVDGVYPACGNTDWTCGFWPGEVWLAYERTGRTPSARRAWPWWTASTGAL